MTNSGLILLVFLCLGTRLSSQSSSETDNQALTQFFQLNTYYSTWAGSSNWLGSNDHCSWEGVTCRQGRVVSLILSRKELGRPGNLNPIGLLDQLEVLDLSWNFFQTTIPESFKDLTHLQTLNLQANNYLTLLFNIFENMENLTQVFLGYNNLGGSANTGEFLGGLKAVRILDLSRNWFRIAPPSIGNLTTLEQLDFSWNDLGYVSGESLQPFFELPELKVLSLTQTGLSDLPSQMKLPKIEVLDLGGNYLGSFPLQVLTLKTLRVLSVDNNVRIGSIPSEINVLDQLETLEVQNCQLSDFPPLKIGSKLKSLQIDTNWLEFLDMSSFVNLESLSFTATTFIPTSMETFSNLKELTLLYVGTYPSQLPPFLVSLSCNDILSPTWPLQWSKTKMISLKSWQVDQNYQPSIPFPDFVFKADEEDQPLFPELTSLQVSGLISGTFPTSFAVSKLETLIVSSDMLTGSISSELSKLSTLKVLTLTTNMKGKIPTEILELKELEELQIQGNSFDASLDTRLEALTNLSVCVLERDPPFECASQDFGKRICNVQCGGIDSIVGTWIRPNSGGPSADPECGLRLTIAEDYHFTSYSQDSPQCGLPASISYYVEGEVKIVQATKNVEGGKSRTYQGQLLFEVSKIYIKIPDPGWTAEWQSYCQPPNITIPTGPWTDVFTNNSCIGSFDQFYAWFPSVQKCPVYHDLFEFDVTRRELKFGEGMLFDPAKCDNFPSQYSTDVISGNWICKDPFYIDPTNYYSSFCYPECGDGQVLAYESCDLGFGDTGHEGTGCTGCWVEDGWTCSYGVDSQGYGHSVCSNGEWSMGKEVVLGLIGGFGHLVILLIVVIMIWAAGGGSAPKEKESHSEV